MTNNDFISEMTQKNERLKSMMANLNGLINEMTMQKDDITKKTNDAINELNSSIAEKEEEINDIYTEIGRRICNVYHDNPLPEVSDLTGKVNDLQNKINDYRSQIEKYKKQMSEYETQIEEYRSQAGEYSVLIETAKITCPQCGNKCDRGSRFCAMCGYKFPDEETQKDNNEEVPENKSWKIKAEPEAKPEESVKEENVKNIVEEKPDEVQADDAPKFCRICGAELDPGSMFCGNCGAKVVDD